MSNRDHRATGRRKRRRPSESHRVEIRNDLWDRVVRLSAAHENFAGTGVPIGRAIVVMLNERLLQLEAEMAKEAS